MWALVLKGYAQAFAKIEQAKPEQRDRMLAAINEGANRMARLVQDMLDISQLQVERLKMKSERLDMAQLVREVVERIAPLAPRHDHACPIVVITASDSARAMAGEVGAAGYIGKPFDVSDLTATVARHLNATG
ncbi:MAG: sensor histidine kinase [Chloroflexota bacterium]